MESELEHHIPLTQGAQEGSGINTRLCRLIYFRRVAYDMLVTPDCSSQMIFEALSFPSELGTSDISVLNWSGDNDVHSLMGNELHWILNLRHK